MNNKLVSVIIPTYNRSSFIKETINSVINQTYQNFEILIIDDGSTDNTKDIVLSFNDQRIQYIYQEHSGFPAVVRNTGMKIAKGEYIAFLDSDDLWFPQKLEKQIKLFEKYPSKLLISTNGIIFPAKPYIKFLDFKKDKIISLNELLRKNIIINSSVLIKRSIINEIGFLDENSILKSGQDYDYWLRLLKHKENSILVLKDILVKYRDHESFKISTNKDPKHFLKKYRKKKYIYNKYTNFNKKYIKSLLRELLYQYKVSRIKIELFKKEISLFGFLKEKSLKVDDKLLIMFEFLYKRLKFDEFAEKSNFLKGCINFIKFTLYKQVKLNRFLIF
ncbi:MAG: glycosyltransferase family 2 protein [Promethearchaeota archaeon]